MLSGLVVYFGLKIAVKPPDADHPYGHGKAEPIAAVVVGLALMTAAFGIIYEGFREITAPHPAPAPYTLIVLAGVLIIKELLFCCSGRFSPWANPSQASRSKVTPGTTEVMPSHQCSLSLAFRSRYLEGRDGKRRMAGQPFAPRW